MSRTAQSARMLDAAVRAIQPFGEPSDLRTAIISATSAAKHVSHLLNANAWEGTVSAAEYEAWEARQLMLAEFAKHGIGRALLRDLGDLL